MRELLQQAKQSVNKISDEQIKNILLKSIELLEKKVKEFLLDVEDLTFISLDDLEIQLAEIPTLLKKAQTNIDEINSVDARLKRKANAILKKLLEEGVQSLQDMLNEKRKPAANQSQASSSTQPVTSSQSDFAPISSAAISANRAGFFTPVTGEGVIAALPQQGAYAQDNEAKGHVLTFTEDGAQGSASAVGNKAGGNVVTLVGGQESLTVLRSFEKK